jgi:hypothetical protein
MQDESYCSHGKGEEGRRASEIHGNYSWEHRTGEDPADYYIRRLLHFILFSLDLDLELPGEAGIVDREASGVGNICRAVPLLAGPFAPNRSIKFLSSLSDLFYASLPITADSPTQQVDNLPRCNTRASPSLPCIRNTVGTYPHPHRRRLHRILIHISTVFCSGGCSHCWVCDWRSHRGYLRPLVRGRHFVVPLHYTNHFKLRCRTPKASASSSSPDAQRPLPLPWSVSCGDYLNSAPVKSREPKFRPSERRRE